MHAVTIGPWVFAIGLVALVLGWTVANAAAWCVKRRMHADAGTPLWVLPLIALVVARAAYVASAWHAYAAFPASVLDIRDGGFSWIAGVVVLVLGTLVWMWRSPRLRRALPLSMGAGLAMWAVVAIGAPRLGNQNADSPLPSLTLQQLNGQPVRLSALEGKPMIVNIWATWCGPCRSEMPTLVAASHSMHGVRFLFVDHGETAGTVKNYLKKAGLKPKHVLLDTQGKLMMDYHLPGCPATLFVSPSGQVRDVHMGTLSAAALRANVHRFLTHAKG